MQSSKVSHEEGVWQGGAAWRVIAGDTGAGGPSVGAALCFLSSSCCTPHGWAQEREARPRKEVAWLDITTSTGALQAVWVEPSSFCSSFVVSDAKVTTVWGHWL